MAKSTTFPPVVAVLGHVDHGKTTLLDTIRKTSVASAEAGGITQRIGAYQVEVPHEGKKKKITFIDTPGHEAFLKMRSRGASVADISLLVVAADDGIMPQTKESIEHIKKAQTPFIVVLTKTDLPSAEPEKVKGQLGKEGIMLEGAGGDVPFIAVSAKTGTGIKELLELILLVSEINAISKEDATAFSGIVIESWLEPRSGPLATIIVKSGKLHVGETVSCEGEKAKVKALISFDGKRVPEGLPGDPLEILGFSQVPPVGGVVGALVEGKEETRQEEKPEKLAAILGFTPEEKKLPIILKVDTHGSLEAITPALPDNVMVIEKGTGAITDADVLLAKTASALVVGFNVKPSVQVAKLAQTEKVIVKTYTIIYELLQELQEASEIIKETGETIVGKAEIQATFPFKDQKVLGVRVTEGYMQKGMKAILMRKDEEIGRATITSIRQGKEEKNRIEKGQECGILLSSSLDFSLGDMLLSFNS